MEKGKGDMDFLAEVTEPTKEIINEIDSKLKKLNKALNLLDFSEDEKEIIDEYLSHNDAPRAVVSGKWYSPLFGIYWRECYERMKKIRDMLRMLCALLFSTEKSKNKNNLKHHFLEFPYFIRQFTVINQTSTVKEFNSVSQYFLTLLNLNYNEFKYKECNCNKHSIA